MKNIISFEANGSTAQWNAEFILNELKNKFNFPISGSITSTSKFGIRCEISAEPKGEEDQKKLISEVMGYASHALLLC